MSISNLFIIGAGFTRAVFPEAPLNDDLLTQIVETNPDSPLGRIWLKYGSPNTNIEELLTRLDLDLLAGKSEFDEGQRNAISAQLAEVVSHFRFKQDVEWLHPLTRIISDNDVIISLNYDCFLEGFLDSHEAWSPKGGYHTIDANSVWNDSLPDNQRKIRILKIHGSESFHRAPIVNKPESLTIHVEINSELFPRSGKDKHLGCLNDAGPYVIAPSFTKQFDVELYYLLLDAIQFAADAKNLIIIGCGLRPEDNYLWLVLTSFMKHPQWKEKRTFIANRKSSSETATRLKNFWGVNIFDEKNLVLFESDFKSEIGALEQALRSRNNPRALRRHA
jgi:hypothetical protein